MLKRQSLNPARSFRDDQSAGASLADFARSLSTRFTRVPDKAFSQPSLGPQSASFSSSLRDE
jgi:hypothetical protein